MKTYFNWSTGKDSALALYYLQQDERHEITQLLTSVNSVYDRVSMHGIRRSLLEQQVKSLGIPFSTLELPKEPGTKIYNDLIKVEVVKLVADGYEQAAFGDIFLEDLRDYRENQLKELNIQACFPLWNRNTKELIGEFLDLGFKAMVVCINSQFLDSSFVGRNLDRDFLEALPSNVDPCGENGEFHTFCYDGPIFSSPVEFNLGEKIYKEYKDPISSKIPVGFWFCDLLPINKNNVMQD